MKRFYATKSTSAPVPKPKPQEPRKIPPAPPSPVLPAPPPQRPNKTLNFQAVKRDAESTDTASEDDSWDPRRQPPTSIYRTNTNKFTPKASSSTVSASSTPNSAAGYPTVKAGIPKQVPASIMTVGAGKETPNTGTLKRQPDVKRLSPRVDLPNAPSTPHVLVLGKPVQKTTSRATLPSSGTSSVDAKTKVINHPGQTTHPVGKPIPSSSVTGIVAASSVKAGKGGNHLIVLPSPSVKAVTAMPAPYTNSVTAKKATHVPEAVKYYAVPRQALGSSAPVDVAEKRVTRQQDMPRATTLAPVMYLDNKKRKTDSSPVVMVIQPQQQKTLSASLKPSPSVTSAVLEMGSLAIATGVPRQPQLTAKPTTQTNPSNSPVIAGVLKPGQIMTLKPPGTMLQTLYMPKALPIPRVSVVLPPKPKDAKTSNATVHGKSKSKKPSRKRKLALDSDSDSGKIPSKRLKKNKSKRTVSVSESSSDEGNLAALDEVDPGTFQVEKVISKRKNHSTNKMEYCIRWVGYSPDDDTWEAEENCSCPEAIAQYEEQQERKKPKKAPVKPMAKDAARPAKRQKATLRSGAAPALAKKPLGPNGQTAVPVKVLTPWDLLSPKVLKTIPQSLRTRINAKDWPAKVTDSKNPTLGGEDDGCQRYLCEWVDGITCWLPGKICSKFFPKIVCAFALESLPQQIIKCVV